MVLTEREELIISYMIVPSNRMKDVFNTYKSLSNEELKNMIDKMDDYMDEVGETYRSFGIYDEVYRLELTHVKELLLEEYQSRKRTFDHKHGILLIESSDLKNKKAR